MKRVVAMCVGGIAVLCAAALARQEPRPALTGKSVTDLAWMSGVWMSEQGKGPRYEEHWMMPAGGVMIGMSRMATSERTMFFEFLRIAQTKEGSIVYYAMPMGRGEPTPFTLTGLDSTKAVFENPAHDDPKVITYTLDGDLLTAVTEGEKNGKPTRNVFAMKRAGK